MINVFSFAFVMGLLSLDTTAVGQFMVSRPIVVGPLVGWMLGDVGLGLAVGALVELIWISDLPVGAHLPIDLTLLAGVSTVSAMELTRAGTTIEAAVTYSLCAVIPLAVLSSEIENLIRKLNVRVVRWTQTRVEGGHLGVFEWANAFILLVHYLKAFLVAIGSLLAAYGMVRLFPRLPAEVALGLGYAPWFLMAVGCAAAIDLVVDPRLLPALIISVGCSFVLIFSLQVPPLYLLPAALFAGFLFGLFRVRKEGGFS